MDIFAIINNVTEEIFDLCTFVPGEITVEKSEIYYMSILLPYKIESNNVFKIVEDFEVDLETEELTYYYTPTFLGKLETTKEEFKKLLDDAMMRRYVREEYGEEL